MKYSEFLESKKEKPILSGFSTEEVNKNLFDYQSAIVKWALRKGRCALFEDTGLGKTIQQLSWAEQVVKHTGENVLILAPLAVAKQTAKESKKFGIDCYLCNEQSEVKKGINITNYEKIHKFDTDTFVGVVLDESSIIKNYTGKTTIDFIERFKYTPYKLCCTATPSPNDFTEIGTTAEFLGIMTMGEMLSTYFINDISTGIGWRLKRHAVNDFFRWIATWSMMIKDPSDIGYDGSKFNLPKLNIETIIIESERDESSLFVELAETLTERREARKLSLKERIAATKKIVEDTEQCLVWCDYNYESEELAKTINQSVEVKGSDKPSFKENSMIGFSEGSVKYLISKPSICGFGMNWQNCHNMVFCGLSDSYEQFYQAIRRCYRFGQTKEVNVYVIISEKEMNVLNNIKNKQKNHELMSKQMIEIMKDIAIGELTNNKKKVIEYIPQVEMKIPNNFL